MSRNSPAVEKINCRVDIDNAIWVLAKYESQQESSWRKFNTVTEMNRFVQATNLQCPQRCLTPDLSNKMIGDYNRKIASLERELQACKALLAKQNLPNLPLASPLVTTTSNQNNRVTTGTVQSSGSSSSTSTSNTNNSNSVVGPLGAKLGNTYPAVLQNSFTSGLKRSASVLSVPSSGNNSEAESLSGVRKLSKNASRIARSTSVTNMSGTSAGVGANSGVSLVRTTPTISNVSVNSSGSKSTNKGIDLHSALRALPRKAAVLDTLDPYHSDNSTTGTGTANSSQDTPLHTGGALLGSRGGARSSAGSGVGSDSESDGGYNRQRDLECSVDTDDIGYGSESSVSVPSGPNSVTKPFNTASVGSRGGSGGSGGEMVGIALTVEPTHINANTNTNTTASPVNKRALRRSQSVESVNSTHSASSVNSVNSGGGSTNSRRRRIPVPSPAHTNTTYNNAGTTINTTNTSHTTHTTLNASTEDDSRMSLRLSQDDEESRSLLFAGLQDNSRTFTYTKNNNMGAGSGSSSGTSNGSGSGSGSSGSNSSGGLFGMVMSFASNYGNYVSKYLTPSQEERERERKRLSTNPTSTTINATSAVSTTSSNAINTSTYSQGEDSCIMEYTRDATTFPHYPTNTTTTNTNTTNTNTNTNTINTNTSNDNDLPVLHTETPSDSLPIFDPYNNDNEEDTQSTQGTANTLQTLLTHDSTAEAEIEVVLVPVDWARITTDTQTALGVFKKAIEKSALSLILKSTLLRGIVTKEITPIECAAELCHILRYSLKQAATDSARKQQQEVFLTLTKLLQKFTVRNKKVPISTSEALGVKTVAVCCIVQICTNIMYCGASKGIGSGKSGSSGIGGSGSSGVSDGSGVVESCVEAVSSSIDRLVLMLTSPFMAKDDTQWLLTGVDTNTPNTTNTSTDTNTAYTTTYDNYYPRSPPPLDKAPIESFVHYLKDKYSDTSVWSSVRECVLRYDYTYQRHLISPVKVVPVEVKRSKRKAVVDIVGSSAGHSANGSGTSGVNVSSDVVVEVGSQVLPPRGRADSLKNTTSTSTTLSSNTSTNTNTSTSAITEAVPAAPTLKRQSSLIGGLLQQTRSKLRGDSGSFSASDTGVSGSDAVTAQPNVGDVPNVTSATSSGSTTIRRATTMPVNSTTASLPANNTTNNNTNNTTTADTTTTATTTAPTRRLLVTKKAPLVGHRMSMGNNKNVVISAKTLAATAAAAAVAQAAPPAPAKPVVSLFQASEFAKTPNKTRSITFSQGMGGGHATPVNSQTLEEFSFSTQRQGGTGGARGSASHTVVENTPMEALQTRRGSASARRGYLSGGVGYMSSPSPEGASARRRTRAHRTHAEGGVGSAGSNGSGSGSGGSGGRVRHNRLSSFFATQDDAEDSDHPLEHSLEHSLAPPRRHHLGHTEVRAVGAGGAFESSQASQVALSDLGVLGGMGTPDAYIMSESDVLGGAHPLGSFLNGSTYHSLHGAEDDEEV